MWQICGWLRHEHEQDRNPWASSWQASRICWLPMLDITCMAALGHPFLTFKQVLVPVFAVLRSLLKCQGLEGCEHRSGGKQEWARELPNGQAL